MKVEQRIAKSSILIDKIYETSAKKPIKIEKIFLIFAKKICRLAAVILFRTKKSDELIEKESYLIAKEEKDKTGYDQKLVRTKVRH